MSATTELMIDIHKWRAALNRLQTDLNRLERYVRVLDRLPCACVTIREGDATYPGNSSVPLDKGVEKYVSEIALQAAENLTRRDMAKLASRLMAIFANCHLLDGASSVEGFNGSKEED